MSRGEDWIAVGVELFRHPRFLDFIAELDVDEVRGVGYLVKFWTTAFRLVPDGDVSGMEPRKVARMTGWRGSPERMYEALTTSGLVDSTGRIHDWDSWGGRLHKSRRDAAERMRNHRTPNDGDAPEFEPDVRERFANGTRTVRECSSLKSRELREEKEEACVKNTHAAKKENPLTPDFLDWWTAWGKRGSRADAALCYAFWIARGASPADLLTAARNYLADCRRCERKQKDGATFLAKKPNRWEEWLERGDVDQRQKYRHPDGTVRYQDDDSLVPCKT